MVGFNFLINNRDIKSQADMEGLDHRNYLQLHLNTCIKYLILLLPLGGSSAIRESYMLLSVILLHRLLFEENIQYVYFADPLAEFLGWLIIF